MIEEGKVYYLSTAKVEIAKKQFSTVKNDYEIILQRDSQIQLVCYNRCVCYDRCLRKFTGILSHALLIVDQYSYFYFLGSR